MNTPTLADVQARFQAFVLRDEDGPPAGLDAVGAGVYAEGYFLRLSEALANDYPVLKRLLGDTAFADMARTYALAWPSRHYSVRWFGEQLPRFLRITPPFSAEPYLAELASLEWLMGEAFDAADAPVIGVAEVAALPATDWPALILHFHPSVRRLKAHHDVVALWRGRAAEMGASADGPIPKLQHVVVWRRDLEVYFRPLDPGETLALDVLEGGGSFAAACEAMSAAVGPGTEPAALIAGWLRQWLAEGLVAGAFA
ncbi:MAG: DNA-binding domain-containing protein [Gammaproteobacteria bacterium]